MAVVDRLPDLRSTRGNRDAGASATFTDLNVEQHPDRYTGRLEEEPALFERVLISTVNHLSHFRAGHTPYGPSSSQVLLASDGQQVLSCAGRRCAFWGESGHSLDACW